DARVAEHVPGLAGHRLVEVLAIAEIGAEKRALAVPIAGDEANAVLVEDVEEVVLERVADAGETGAQAHDRRVGREDLAAPLRGEMAELSLLLVVARDRRHEVSAGRQHLRDRGELVEQPVDDAGERLCVTSGILRGPGDLLREHAMRYQGRADDR